MRKKSASPDLAIAAIARRQHGVVAIGQLRLAGLSDYAVLRRVRAGRLHRVHRGVYAVGHAGLSIDGRWMAAVLACGRGPVVPGEREAAPGKGKQAGEFSHETALEQWGAALSHRSAAALWGLLPASDGPVDVSVPGAGGRQRRSGIRLHRSISLLPSSVTLRDGIPVTTPARTLADLRRVVGRPHRPSLVSPWELRRATRQADVRGLPTGREVNRDRTRSDLERDFLRLCECYGLPTPEVNVRVGGYRVDFLWRDRRFVIETDGYQYHRGQAAFDDDRRRDLALRESGYQVVRLSDQQLTDEPQRVAEAVRLMLTTIADR